MKFDSVTYWGYVLDGAVYGIIWITFVKAWIWYELTISLWLITVIWSIVALTHSILPYATTNAWFFIVYSPIQQSLIICVRVLLLFNFMKRLRDVYWMLRVLFYVLCITTQILFIVLLEYTITCDILKLSCTPLSIRTLTIYDGINNVVFDSIILSLDLVFMIKLSVYLYKEEGGKSAILYRKHMYHLFLLFFALVAVSVNFIRLFAVPFGYPLTSGIWLYVETAFILSLLDYGVNFSTIVRSSTLDTNRQKLEDASEKLVLAQSSKEKIVRYLHHSLRNNVQRITLAHHVLKSAVFHETREAIAERIDVLSVMIQQMTVLIDDVETMEFDDTKTHVNDMGERVVELKKKDFNLSKLIQDEARVINIFEQRNISRIRTWVPDNIWIHCDQNRYRQLFNIIRETYLENAEDHAEIYLSNNNELFIVIRLTTVLNGRPPSVRELDLEKLEDINRMSIAILKLLVHSFDGSVTHDENEIVLKIPLHIVRRSNPSDSLSSSQIVQKRRRKILVVDDSPVNRKLIIRMINATWKNDPNYTTDQAENGKNAIEMMEATETNEMYDLVFLDVMMPIMDGRKLAE